MKNKFLITYNPIIYKEKCLEHGLDFFVFVFFNLLEKEYKGNIEKKLDSFKDVSIAKTAMVNAYAKIIMHKYKLEILKNGGSIYYSDTYSIVLDKIYFNKEWISSEKVNLN